MQITSERLTTRDATQPANGSVHLKQQPMPCALVSVAPAGRSRLLSPSKLDAMFEQLGTPEFGRKKIEHIRASLPGRATSSTARSGKLRFPSLKMGFALEAEAYGTEMLAITEWDHDDETLEFYTQPDCRLKITFRAGHSGKRITTYTLPDAFRITKQGLIFTECKTQEWLEAECVRQPERWVRLPDGNWSSPPAEEAAATLGCSYEVRSSRTNNWALHENLELLRDHYVAYSEGLFAASNGEIKEQVFERFAGRLCVSAFDLIHVEPKVFADDLYRLIVTGEIYFPMCRLRLTDQCNALFFRNEADWQSHRLFLEVDRPDRRTHGPRAELRHGDIFEWDSVRYEVVNPGKDGLTARVLSDPQQPLVKLPRKQVQQILDSDLTVVADGGQAARPSASERDETYEKATPEEIKEAVWRLQVLFDVPADDNPLKGRCERTQMYWLSSYRAAEARWGNGFLGLLAQRVGNPSPKVDAGTKELAQNVIDKDWATVRRKGRMTSYGEYVRQCKEKGYEPLSYSTFCRMVKAGKGFAQLSARIGNKAAYDLEPQYLELDRHTPVHGTHSWHIGHIDHTPLPLQFLTGDSADFARTVWLTLLMSAHDRKVYAYYLSFDEPSYRSCMMVIRDCVQRHGRFFQYVVVDGGSDFESGYFEKLLARLYCKKRSRPKGKPRFGSVVERLFGTTQQQFVKVLLGATDLVETHFRAISKEVAPREQAVWILNRFDKAFEQYLDSVYHVNHHSGLDMSPNHAAAFSEQDHGARLFRRLPYDEQFIAETCPQPKGEEVMVQPQGVKMNYIWYSGPALRLPGVSRTKVPARYDPWNCGVAYVFVQRRWHQVHSTYHAVFSGFTERAMRKAAAALRAVARVRHEKAVVNAERLAAFLFQISEDETVARQLRDDAEATKHRQKIGRVERPAKKPVDAPGDSSTQPIEPPPVAAPMPVPRPPVKLQPLEIE